MRALILLLLLTACDGEVLVDIDAGVPDAGVHDAGFRDAGVVDDVDAGFDEPDAGADLCNDDDVEDIEVPFECEPDADWCSPRDQFRAWYDLAAGWSHQLDEETWVLEVRTWGRPLPWNNVGYVGLGVALNGDDTADRVVPFPQQTDQCFGPPTVDIGDGDLFHFRYSEETGLWCWQCPPTGINGLGRECESTRDCSAWQVSSDFTTFRVVLPTITPALFWFGHAGTWGCDSCEDFSGHFVPSRGGSADVLEWLPLEAALSLD
jgi:hypothetical protein